MIAYAHLTQNVLDFLHWKCPLPYFQQPSKALHSHNSHCEISSIYPALAFGPVVVYADSFIPLLLDGSTKKKQHG